MINANARGELVVRVMPPGAQPGGPLVVDGRRAYGELLGLEQCVVQEDSWGACSVLVNPGNALQAVAPGLWVAAVAPVCCSPLSCASMWTLQTCSAACSEDEWEVSCRVWWCVSAAQRQRAGSPRTSNF